MQHTQLTEPKFLSSLRVEKIGERTWILLESLIFFSIKYQGIYIAPRGFQTNLSSIPRVAFALFPPIGNYDKAAVIHDAGYGNSLLTESYDRMFTSKELADGLFNEGMKAEKVNTIVRRTMYRSVRLFGDPVGHPLAANRV